MSLMSQMLGNTPAINPRLFEPDGPRAIAYGMGLTAETVATRWGIGREAQDAFAAASHAKALALAQSGRALPHRDRAVPGARAQAQQCRRHGAQS